MKCGTVSLIGRPNVGKSSLINALLKTHAVIISPKPQTTRNSIRCIYNDENSQIIFTDTPGLYRVKNERDKLGVFLNEAILESIENSDVILWLIDASTKKLQQDDYEIAEILTSSTPVILVANKSDKSDPSQAFKLYESLHKFAAKISVSARLSLMYNPSVSRKTSPLKRGDGIENLMQVLLPLIPEGEAIYDPDILMDTTEKFMAAEIIREKILMLLRDEIPHCVAVEIEEYKSPDEFPELAKRKLYIRASLIVETTGQKKILIGSDGNMIKKIGAVSRKSIEEITGLPVYLELWVKVVANWRRKPAILKNLGYSLDMKIMS